MSSANNKKKAGRPSSDVKLGFAESFFLSGTAAAISKTSAAPIERVKLLLQNQNELLKQGKLSQGYSGARDCISKTFQHEGLWSFWRGNLASVIRYFPQQALNFAFKDQVNGKISHYQMWVPNRYTV